MAVKHFRTGSFPRYRLSHLHSLILYGTPITERGLQHLPSHQPVSYQLVARATEHFPPPSDSGWAAAAADVRRAWFSASRVPDIRSGRNAGEFSSVSFSMSEGNQRTRKRPPQFTLRFLLLMVAVFGVGIGWVAIAMRQAKRQREAATVFIDWGVTSLILGEPQYSKKLFRTLSPTSSGTRLTCRKHVRS